MSASSAPVGHDIVGAARAFAEDHERRLAPLTVAATEAWWQLATTGLDEHASRRAALELDIRRVFRDAGAHTRVRSFDRQLAERTGVDPRLGRVIRILKLAYLQGQVDERTLAAEVHLEAEADNVFNRHRGAVDGRAVDDNEIRRVLGTSMDPRERRVAWEASKSIGPEVAPRILDLVRLRNESARSLGFRDHRALALTVSEIDETWLDGFLADLERRTREPFAALKSELDATLAHRFGVTPDALRPWHYGDPFFQEPDARAPGGGESERDLGGAEDVFAGIDLVEVAARTFDRLGLDVRGALVASDLKPRPGKCQHAFCVSIDRVRDVRVIANVVPDAYWAATMLHELGHAVHELYLDPTLPFLIRCPAHPFTTEAVAMLFGRLVNDPAWLAGDLELDPAEVARLTARATRTARAGRLVFARFALAFVEFERALYADPEGDLDARWWEIVGRLQGLARPLDRAGVPDWAAKIHLATSPVYYQSYLLGETLASQIVATVRARTGRGIVGNRDAGRYLVEAVFRPGASLRWDDLVRSATGSDLDPAAYLAVD